MSVAEVEVLPVECLVSLEWDRDSGEVAVAVALALAVAVEVGVVAPPCCFLGFLFLVWMPSLRMLMGRFTPCSL